MGYFSWAPLILPILLEVLLRGGTLPKERLETKGPVGTSPHVGVSGACTCTPKTRPCWNSGQLSHWERDFGQNKKPAPPGAGVKSVSCPHTTSARIHVAALVGGKPVRCLLDSGCERSVIARKLVPNLRLTSSRYILPQIVGWICLSWEMPISNSPLTVTIRGKCLRLA